jgi:hypothetical protein
MESWIHPVIQVAGNEGVGESQLPRVRPCPTLLAMSARIGLSDRTQAQTFHLGYRSDAASLAQENSLAHFSELNSVRQQ